MGLGGDAGFAHFVALNISFNSLSLSFQLWQRRNAPDEGGDGGLRVSSRHSAMIFWSGRETPGTGEHVSLCPGRVLEISRVQGFRAGVRLESNPRSLIGQPVLVVFRCPWRLHLHCPTEFSYSFLSQKADSSPRQVFLLTFLGMGSFILLIISLLRSSKKFFFSSLPGTES